jgi:hypothetical protein
MHVKAGVPGRTSAGTRAASGDNSTRRHEQNRAAVVFSEAIKLENRTMKKLVLAAAVLMAATSAAMAQGYGYGAPYGYGTYGYAPGSGVYDSAPGYGVYDFSPGYGAYGNNPYDYDRSDAPGRGNSAESQR